MHRRNGWELRDWPSYVLGSNGRDFIKLQKEDQDQDQTQIIQKKEHN